MKEISHLELYSSINGYKNGFYGYYLVLISLNKRLSNLTETDYFGLLDFLKDETEQFNLVNENDKHIYYKVVKENDVIKIIVKKGTKDNFKTISKFKINIVDHYRINPISIQY